jgi:hypothetical protein
MLKRRLLALQVGFEIFFEVAAMFALRFAKQMWQLDIATPFFSTHAGHYLAQLAKLS